jgi:hypothetical protein
MVITRFPQKIISLAEEERFCILRTWRIFGQWEEFIGLCDSDKRNPNVPLSFPYGKSISGTE